MSENKPEGTDSVSTDVTSEAEAISQRIAAGREKQKADNILEPLAQDESEVVKPEGTKDVDTQGSSSDNKVNADSVALKLIETSTGRKFDKIEDAQKFLTNLNSLVGDQNVAKAREAQEVLTNLSKKFGKTDVKELETYLADIVLNQTQQQKPAETVKPESTKVETDPLFVSRLEQLEHSNQLLSLEKKYPMASEVADEVALIAKAKGVSYIEAFESSPLKNLVEFKAKEESVKNPIVTPSNRTNTDYKKVQILAQKAKSGQALTSAEQLELTKEVLGI